MISNPYLEYQLMAYPNNTSGMHAAYSQAIMQGRPITFYQYQPIDSNALQGSIVPPAPSLSHSLINMTHPNQFNNRQYLLQMKNQLVNQLKQIEEALSALDKEEQK